MDAPVNTYFDVTPSGWILNRFSKDLEKLDRDMADTLFDSVDELTSLLILIYVISFNSGWLLVIFPIVGTLLYFLIRYYIKSYRELVRLELVAYSPVLTVFGETLGGVSTIRSFGREGFY